MKKLIIFVAILLLVTGCRRQRVLECTYVENLGNEIVTTENRYIFSRDGSYLNSLEWIVRLELTGELHNIYDILREVESDCDELNSERAMTCSVSRRNNVVTRRITFDLSLADQNDEELAELRNTSYDRMRASYNYSRYVCN